MDRRKFLCVGGTVTTLAIAGCTADDDEPEVVDDDDSDSDDNGAEDTDDESETTEDDEEAEAEEIDAVVGDLVEGDEMHLVIENFDRGVDLGEFAEPDAGNEFASVTVALKNVSDDFVSVSNLLQTRIHDNEGYSYDQTFFGGEEPTFNDGQFAPGEVERGAINFEIPDDAEGLELVWDFDIGLFSGIDRVYINLEDETSVHTLEQDLQIDVHDVGTTIEFGDVQVTVNEVRTESELGTFTEPDPGNEFVVVDISIENQTGEEERISTILQMLIKDGEGWSHQEDFGAAVELDRAFDEGSPIADGETRSGEVAYELEEGLSPLYWIFEFSLWTDGDKTFWQIR